MFLQKQNAQNLMEFPNMVMTERASCQTLHSSVANYSRVGNYSSVCSDFASVVFLAEVLAVNNFGVF